MQNGMCGIFNEHMIFSYFSPTPCIDIPYEFERNSSNTGTRYTSLPLLELPPHVDLRLCLMLLYISLMGFIYIICVLIQISLNITIIFSRQHDSSQWYDIVLSTLIALLWAPKGLISMKSVFGVK